MSTGTPTLAIDLGGTNIKVGVVHGVQVLCSDSIPAHAREGLSPQLPRLKELFEKLCAQVGVVPSRCGGLGMALPFLVDPVRNRILSVPPEKYGDACSLDLAGWARTQFGLGLKLENDAHAACLGEWRHGAGRGSDDLVMLTLGTGIGCSVIIRGRPLRGKHFQAGVLGGHLVSDPAGAACSVCPSQGCYEAESASLSLPRIARSHDCFDSSALSREPVIDFAAVFRHAAAGDYVALAVRDRCIRYWSALAVSLVHAYDPDRIVIGGAVAGSASSFLQAIKEHVNRYAWITEPVDLCVAELGNNAALIGAASLFEKETSCI